MYAIIADSGQQFRVEEGQTIQIDTRDADAGAEMTFDRVLLVSDENGVRIGKPVVKGAQVSAEVVGPSQGPKLEIVQVRP